MKMENKYQNGQKVDVPRELRPLLEEIIAKRSQYDIEYRHEVATAFGYGAKELGAGFEFALDYKKGVAFAYKDTPENRIAEAPMETIRVAIAKIIMGRHSNQIVVDILEGTMMDMVHFHWKLHPQEMTIEILGQKQMPQPTVPDTGEVQ